MKVFNESPKDITSQYTTGFMKENEDFVMNSLEVNVLTDHKILIESYRILNW